MIDLSIVIVAYRSADDLPGLLASLPGAAGGLSWRATVVDNYGLDGLSAGDDPRVTLIPAGSNLGYSGGLNLGVSRAPSSRFTVFLNPDLVLDVGSLEGLVQACGPSGVGAAVPLVLDALGVPQLSLRREPTTLRSLGEALFGDHWPRRPHFLAEMVRGEEGYRTPTSVDWATGAALVVRTEVLSEVGAWDSGRFFLYSEETDFSRRIRARGLEIAFSPGAVVRHRGAGSGSSPELDALLFVNKIRYFRKWHDAGSTAVFFLVAVLHNLLRLNRPASRLTLRALFSPAVRSALPGGTP